MSFIPLYNLNFNIDEQSGTVGYFTLTDNSDYTGVTIADVVGYVRIDYPDGSFYEGSFAFPDIVPDVSLTNTSIPIPVDSNSDYLTGTYTSSYHVEISSGLYAGTYETSTTNFYFNPTNPENPGASADVNCFYALVTLTDLTNYGTPTTDAVWAVSRVMTIYPPLAGTPTSTTGSSYTYSLSTYGFGLYQFLINTALTYSTADDVYTITARTKGAENEDLKCDVNLCGLNKCIKAFKNRYVAASNRSGGTQYVSEEMQDTRNLLEVYWMDFTASLQCSDYTEATIAYDKMVELLGCDCNCDITDLPTPVPSVSSDDLTFQATSPLGVTSVTSMGTTTVTYFINPTLLAQITQIIADIAAMDITLNITQDNFNSTIGSPAAITGSVTQLDTTQFQINLELQDEPAMITPSVGAVSVGGTNSTVTQASGNNLKYGYEVTGYVHLIGAISFTAAPANVSVFAGDGGRYVSCFILPSGYRPAANERFPIVATNTNGLSTNQVEGYCRVFAGGDVVCFFPITTSVTTASINFNAIRFLAAA